VYKNAYKTRCTTTPGECSCPSATRRFLPVGAETLPVGAEALPVGAEALPVGAEALPVGAEALPVNRLATPPRCRVTVWGPLRLRSTRSYRHARSAAVFARPEPPDALRRSETPVIR